MNTSNACNARRNVPADLRAAYAWTAAAGELGLLSSLEGDALQEYAIDSTQNAREHGESDVFPLHLRELASWLRSEVAR